MKSNKVNGVIELESTVTKLSNRTVTKLSMTAVLDIITDLWVTWISGLVSPATNLCSHVLCTHLLSNIYCIVMKVLWGISVSMQNTDSCIAPLVIFTIILCYISLQYSN